MSSYHHIESSHLGHMRIWYSD